MDIFGDKPVMDEENYENIRKAIAVFYPQLIDSTIEFLAFGTYAKAYKVDNLVFKITRDRDDALASMRVMGKDLQHIVKIHKVFKIHHSNRYLIVSDYVPHSIYESRKYEDLIEDLEDVMDEIKSHLFYENPIETVDFAQYGLPIEIEEEIEEFLNELIGNGFTNADAHDDNIRIDADDKFKLIDLGHYTSKGDKVSKIEELV